MSRSDRPLANKDMQLVVPAPIKNTVAAFPPRPPSNSSTALVEYTPPAANPEDEDLEIKLRRIIDHVPVRVSNTSGSSAGSGSGDFHQYRQMRRKEQDRLTRMDVDFQKRKEVAEFNKRREERLKAAEERTAKKRMKRQKKKQRKKEKKSKLNSSDGEGLQKEESSDDDDQDSENDEKTALSNTTSVPPDVAKSVKPPRCLECCKTKNNNSNKLLFFPLFDCR